MVLEAAEPDERELRVHDRVDAVVVERGPLLQRQRDVLADASCEPKSAPDWKRTPNAGGPPSLVGPSTPWMCTRPPIGTSRPIMLRSSVDLPEPLPPRIANTSPAATSNVSVSHEHAVAPADRQRVDVDHRLAHMP